MFLSRKDGLTAQTQDQQSAIHTELCQAPLCSPGSPAALMVVSSKHPAELFMCLLLDFRRANALWGTVEIKYPGIPQF